MSREEVLERFPRRGFYQHEGWVRSRRGRECKIGQWAVPALWRDILGGCETKAANRGRPNRRGRLRSCGFTTYDRVGNRRVAESGVIW